MSTDDIEDIFYGDQTDNIACDQEIANKQYDKYGTRFYNEGFREALSLLQDEAGVDASKENILQASFDQGYETAFVTSKQLFSAITAVKTYLELGKKDNSEAFSSEHVSDLEKLNLDLDAAKIKLDELVKDGIGVSVTPESKASDSVNTNNSSQQSIVELDERWRSKINDIINLQDLRMRSTKLLGIDI